MAAPAAGMAGTYASYNIYAQPGSKRAMPANQPQLICMTVTTAMTIMIRVEWLDRLLPIVCWLCGSCEGGGVEVKRRASYILVQLYVVALCCPAAPRYLRCLCF
jgi:hypothetical protein